MFFFFAVKINHFPEKNRDKNVKVANFADIMLEKKLAGRFRQQSFMKLVTVLACIRNLH